MATPKDGVHFGVSEEEYDAWEAVRNSTLGKFVDRTDAHAYHDLYVVGEDATPATKFGTAFHLSLLEPERFKNAVVTEVPGPFRSNAAKAAREAQRAEHPEGLILAAKDLLQIEGMQRAVFGSSLCRELLAGPGKAEVSLLWTDPGWGVRCKARPDWITQWRGMFTIVDMKSSAREASKEDFSRVMGEFGYHRQDVFYSRGFDVLQGPAVRPFLFLVVPTKAPYVPGVHECAPEAKDQALYELDNAMERYKRCRETKAWPGWGTEPMITDLPAWKRRRD